MCAKIDLNVQSYGKVIAKTKLCNFMGHNVLSKLSFTVIKGELV